MAGLGHWSCRIVCWPAMSRGYSEVSFNSAFPWFEPAPEVQEHDLYHAARMTDWVTVSSVVTRRRIKWTYNLLRLSKVWNHTRLSSKRKIPRWFSGWFECFKPLLPFGISPSSVLWKTQETVSTAWRRSHRFISCVSARILGQTYPDAANIRIELGGFAALLSMCRLSVSCCWRKGPEWV